MRRFCGPLLARPSEEDMTYAIIKVAGKQYRVREGERLLVDRLPAGRGRDLRADRPARRRRRGASARSGRRRGDREGARRDEGPEDPDREVQEADGLPRHTGFRASLTQIQIESIGGQAGARSSKPKAETSASRRGRGGRGRCRSGGRPARRVRGHDDRRHQGARPATGTLRPSPRRSSTSRSTRKRKGALAALESAPGG